MKNKPITSFERFVVGENNRLAFAEISGLASQDIKKGQCILLKGSHCSGKTLLLHCFLNEYRQNFPLSNTIVESCESFVCKLMDNINRNDSGANLWPSKCDVLVIEDIDFLSGKLTIQGTLLRMLEKQISMGTLVIITANSNIVFSKTFEDGKFDCTKLIIEEPNNTLRRKILEAKIAERNIKVKRQILVKMVRSEMTMSQLLGVINTMVFVKKVLKGRITARVYERISNQYKRQ